MGGQIHTGTPATGGARRRRERGDPARSASDRRRAAEDALLDALLLPNETSSESIGAEGQTLLARALLRLARQEGVEASVAWSSSADRTPKVLAAQPAHAAGRIQPTPEIYDALSQLDRVQRLTDGGLSIELTALATRGVSAVAPIKGLGATPAAVLLIYGKRAGRPLRPRTIAVLGEVASKLEESMSTSLALDRIGQLDGAVKRLDRLAALGALVSEIVHEIRNPLVSVKTFLQLLPERLDDPAFHGEFRSLVAGEVSRMERMLDDLLRHARPRSKPELGEGSRVADVIDTTLALLTYRCRERGIEVETEIRPDLPELGLAEDALRQLLLNLMLNASEATPSGGRIRLRADWSPNEANHLEIRIDDEGPGLDTALGDRIFEPFWTTRSEGAGGLGLAICKRIVDEAGGTIEATNRKKGGASFRVELPIAN